MKFIIRTFLEFPSEKKWTAYQNHFHQFFSGRDKMFDAAIKFIEDFYHQFEIFPTPHNVAKELTIVGDNDLIKWFESLWNDPESSPHENDSDFITALNVQENILTELDIQTAVGNAQTELSTGVKTRDRIIEVSDGLISDLSKVSARANRVEASTTHLLYGKQSVEEFRQLYEQIQEKKEKGEVIYMDLGLKAFEEVQMKMGDLVFFVAFTSHGKSIMLRHTCYRMLIEYGMNVAFFTFEMSEKVCRTLFGILHANNKAIFPNTPKIPYYAFKHGELDPEQEDFLFNVAVPDLAKNEDYGTLYIDQPNKMNYTLSDLQARLRQLENNIMPIHVVGLDYLSLMWPIEGRGNQPGANDYNELVKRFKNLALTHRNAQGLIKPFLALTCAQASRAGLDKAIKNDGVYDMTCIWLLSEIEKSGDVIFTSMLTPELKKQSLIRLQNLKNRDDAVVIDPENLFIDLPHGPMIGEVQEHSEAELLETLKHIDLS